MISILVAYGSFVLYFGPNWMKSRNAFNIKYVIILYNAVQIYYNYFIFSEAISFKHYFTYLFGFGCIKGVPEDERIFFLNELYRLYWHGTINKMLDLLDTVFFVLTKKHSHITFLHVHHHIILFSTIWIVAKYYCGVEANIIGFCNTIVHMVMYTYYLIAALGPAFKKYLGWKKYLTVMQLVQFTIIIVYAIIALILSCNWNKYILYAMLGECSFNLLLFLNFYRKSYGSEERKQAIMNKMAICGSIQIKETYDINDNVSNDKKYI